VLTDADAPPDADFITLTREVGDSPPGTAAISAGAFLVGSPFAASAASPSNFPTPTSEFIGSVAEVNILRTFRKDSDNNPRFIFTDLAFQLGWETEFGVKCPVGIAECQSADFSHLVRVWDGVSDQPVWTGLTVTSVRTQGDSFANPGYGVSPVALPLTGTIGRAGADICLASPFEVEVDISGIGSGELFIVESVLTVMAKDRGSHLGPGRYVRVRAWDPFDLDSGNGVQLDYTGPHAVGAHPPSGAGAVDAGADDCGAGGGLGLRSSQMR
jgi:hypothetical protein